MKRRIIVSLILVLFFLSGCNNKNTDNKGKIETELDYISTKIFDLANVLNNISLESYELVPRKIEISEDNGGSSSSESEGSSGSSQGGEESEIISSTEMKSSSILDKDMEDSDIKWDEIKTKLELINNSWAIISLDLKEEKVADKDILAFNALLNKTIISVNNENKEETLENISNLYSYIPGFMVDIQGKNYNIIMKKTKNELLKAYVDVAKEKWESVYNYVNNAQNHFNTMLDNREEIKNKEFKITKIQNLIQILKESVEAKDTKVFLLHYKLLIENMNTM